MAQDTLEFYVVPVGGHIAEGNKAVWNFLAELGESTQERGNTQIEYEGRKVQGIRVSREVMEAIRDSEADYHFRFLILSIHPNSGEVKRHFQSHPGIWDTEKRKVIQRLQDQENREAVMALTLPDGAEELLCPLCGNVCRSTGPTSVRMRRMRNHSGYSEVTRHGVPVGVVVNCTCGASGLAPIIARTVE